MDLDDANRSTLLWSIATQAPLFNNTDDALQALDMLVLSKQNLYPDDQIDMTFARIYYQQGDLKKALAHYNAIPKGSDLWLESIEERAWTRLRKNQHDQAVSDITTALASPFAPLVGPESFFLSTLSSLKVCDYPKILKTSKLFRERQKERLQALQTLAKKGTNQATGDLINGFNRYGYTTRAVGHSFQFLPRHFMRDLQFSSNMRLHLDLIAENKASVEILEILGGDSNLKSEIQINKTELKAARNRAMARLKSLAADDLAEFKVIINKLHIVEAEVIQRLHVDERLRGQRPKVAQASDDRNTLSFPYDDDEVWMDEVDHYKSNVKSCPQLPGTKGASL